MGNHRGCRSQNIRGLLAAHAHIPPHTHLMPLAPEVCLENEREFVEHVIETLVTLQANRVVL